MIIYPAIDIKDGKCVRLMQGDALKQTVYGDSPLEMAKRWEREGAGFLHLVDLNGAFSGTSTNLDAIRAIVENVHIPVQLGGGIRTFEDIRYRLESIGVSRVIIGTMALENPYIVEKAAEKYPNRIIVGIDAKNGNVAVRGWMEDSKQSPESLAIHMKDLGIKTIVYTDIARDGTLVGPNVHKTKELVEMTGMEIIASGGIGSLEHVKQIKGTGAAGLIIGKALYEGTIKMHDLKDFLQEEKEC